MKYSYDVVDLRSVIFKSQADGDTRADHEIVLAYLNEKGKKGWRVLGDPNTLSVYFEKAE